MLFWLEEFIGGQLGTLSFIARADDVWNKIATAYLNRGDAKQDAPGHGAAAAIQDYDAAIAIMERLRTELGTDWPVPWRNDLANAHVARGNAKWAAPGHGAAAAIQDYDAAIAIMERLRTELAADWPVPWRNDLAAAYMNRGVAKRAAPGHGAVAAIQDYDAAIAIRERLRAELAADWPVPWRNDLANAYINRGNAKQDAPGHGAAAAIQDYDAAIAIMERLRTELGADWPVPWRNDLAAAYINRGVAKRAAPGHGAAAAIQDYDAAIAIRERLRAELGADWPVPWRNDLAASLYIRALTKAELKDLKKAMGDVMAAGTIQEELVHMLGESCPPSYRQLLDEIHHLARQLSAPVPEPTK